MTLRYRTAALAGVLAVSAAWATTPRAVFAAPAREQLASTRPTERATLPADGTADETPKPEPIEQGDSVAAIVNDTAISTLDVNQRVKLFMVTTGAHPDAKSLDTIRGEILKQLETERIQLLEAQKLNITVSTGEVDHAIDSILSDNHLEKDKLAETLKAAGVHMSTLRGQIAAQIAWSKTVQARYGSEADVTPAQIDTELRQLSQDSNQPRYRVSEIFMSVDKPSDADKVKAAMDDVLKQVRAGAPFPNVAHTVSQNPTAAEGGDLGFIAANQLPPELEKAVAAMHAGQLSEPIRGPGGYYLLALREVQVPEGSKLAEQKPVKPEYPPGVLPLARVLLPIGPKPPAALKARALEAADALRSHIENCKMLPELVAHMQGAVYMNLGTMDLSNLSPQIRGALASTTAGETAQPFASAAGIELIVRCDSAPPKILTYKVPSRDEVENQLYQEQISVLARRYMRDLRRDADIETR